MENFTIYNPVNLHFGKDCLTDFGVIAREYGQRVLLIYGGKSTSKFGYLAKIRELLEKEKISVFEYGKVTPNPTIEQVSEAVAIARENRAEFIVALGGGSVIDAAKITSVCVLDNLDPWSVMTRKITPNRALPLITVLTLAATGTEMNEAAVVENNTAGKKIALVNPLLFPKHSFLNPEFTLTVSREQTAYGIADMIAHAMEAWFGTPAPNLINRFTLSIIEEAMKNGLAAINQPSDYQARFNLMLTATFALNGTTDVCRESGDWGVHSIGHELSLQFDIPHGASLSIVYPAWLTYFENQRKNEIMELGKHIFGVDSTAETICQLVRFFNQIGTPTQLPWQNIKPEHKTQILEGLNRNRAAGYVHRLTDDDRREIVELMFNPKYC
ncbi:MAG TPA: iron-containing alcohol dehydrogenase [Salinivirgaceae bacterium]|nr:iron-containing alcohol dehydrogenase [Salinivirgaceae bacterium]